MDLQGLIADSTATLAGFLSRVLPEVSDDAWNALVVPSLSYQQRELVDRGGIIALDALDLAALLRVIHGNWSELSYRLGLRNDVRTLVREMQDVRNRWAHLGSQGLSGPDLYRDLDTMERLFQALGIGEGVRQDINERKTQVLYEMTRPETSPPAPPSSQQPEAPASAFQLGDVVALKTDPSVTGAVIDVVVGLPENRYTVLQGAQRRTYYESQLVQLDTAAPERQVVPLHDFHAYLSAIELLEPSVAALYSLNASRVDFIPYQFRPVLKFIRADRPRLLIADEVGVGKTIEAALIMRELQARSKVESILVLCPKPLVTERKWQVELKRFDEQFVHIDGTALRYCLEETHLDGEWPTQYRRAILPFSLLSERTLFGQDGRRGQRGLLDLDPPPKFDLVIVDEAHHVRNASTYAHQAVRFLCEHAEAVVFLTATPIQLGNDDLFSLLNLLRPDLVIDHESFERMSQPNPFINRAIAAARAGSDGWVQQAKQALSSAADTPWGRAVLRGNPDFEALTDVLTHETLSPQDRVAFVRSAEEAHTFSSLINRTRRRDIGAFTIRRSSTVATDFTPEQKLLHDHVLDTQREILQRLHGDQNVIFLMSTLRRQAASSLFGLAPLMREILTRRLPELELVEIDDDFVDDSFDPDAVSSSIRGRIEAVIAMAERLPREDPKLKALKAVITEKQDKTNNKCLLFTSFRHTLAYLEQELQSLGIRIGVVHGAVDDDTRQDLRHRFSLARENPDALDLLLSSEVGSEGLDYQFCDCLLNYDLPWNPMRIEQRIGRIDRYGQRSDVVSIVNFITPGTVDADIYERCLLRIGVFERALGGSEEILGRVTQELKKVALDVQLTPDEVAARLQQLADNEVRLVQEEQALEDNQLELFGIQIPRQVQEQEVRDAETFWLTADALQNLVNRYLLHVFGDDAPRIAGESGIRNLRLSQDARMRLLDDFQTLPPSRSFPAREWERWLKGNDPYLPLTFEASCASADRSVTFVTPVHPLAQQAAHALHERPCAYVMATVCSGDVPPARYAFAVYKWRMLGVREDAVLRAVCEDPTASGVLLKLLAAAEDSLIGDDNLPEQSVFDALDAQHYEVWARQREWHAEQMDRIAKFRLESLSVSHRARMGLLREQREQASDEKIQRMRGAQMRNAEAEYELRVAELERLSRSADIVASAVAFGVLQVVAP